MSLKMGYALNERYKEKWEEQMRQKYGNEELPKEGPDSYEACLCERIDYMSRTISYLEVQKKSLETDYSKTVKQRNLAILFCIIFFCCTVFFAFNPLVQKDREKTRIVNIQYVASVSSDKYHNISCDYAKKIKEENKLYYETEEEARKAGKSPCSVCMP